jgi:hypothetical protein
MRQSAVILEELWFHTILMSCDVPAAEWQKHGAVAGLVGSGKLALGQKNRISVIISNFLSCLHSIGPKQCIPTFYQCLALPFI